MGFFEYLGKNTTYLIIVLCAIALVIIAFVIKHYISDKIFNEKKRKLRTKQVDNNSDKVENQTENTNNIDSNTENNTKE